jgi:hypothetical protein
MEALNDHSCAAGNAELIPLFDVVPAHQLAQVDAADRAAAERAKQRAERAAARARAEAAPRDDGIGTPDRPRPVPTPLTAPTPRVDRTHRP